MFGSTSNSGGGGLFGGANQNKPATGGGGLFGGNATSNTAPASSTGGSLFGSSQNQTQVNTQANTGLPRSNFLSSQSQNQNQNQGPTSLFGQTAQNPQTPSLFGQSTQTQQQPSSQPTTSLFGASTNNNTTLGSSMAQPSNQNNTFSSLSQSQQPSNGLRASTMVSGGGEPQPAGAYFDSLLAKSQKAGGEGKSNMEDLPSLELGLGDLRHRLRKLQSKPSERTLDGKAHYLLAGSGVDPRAALSGLNVKTGAPVDRAAHAPSEVDVETYLSNLQTKTTLDMIADGLERSARDFDNFLEDNVTMEWEAQRKRIYEHFGITPREDSGASRESQAGFGRSSRRSKGPGGMSKAGRSSMFGKSAARSVIGAPSRIGTHTAGFADVERSVADAGPSATRAMDDRATRDKQAKLAEKVRNLNACRLSDRPYPILAELADVTRKSTESHAAHVHEAYLAMAEIVNEIPGAETFVNSATAKERQYAERYLDPDTNSQNAVNMRKKVLKGANRFLETQFLREVEALIAKHPHEAKLGGRPTITSKIKAYVRLRAARKDLVPDGVEPTSMEVKQEGGHMEREYVWAVAFYLLRSGHVQQASEYFRNNWEMFKSLDLGFPLFVASYATSADRRLSSKKASVDCAKHYANLLKNKDMVDPFRLACYKVVGRVDLSDRNLDGLNTDINDWIWLQFNLARETDKTIEMAGESYGLAEVQTTIREIGQKHFPKGPGENNNGSFGMYFYLQLLCGLFEDAVAYLYLFSYVDAVHFGLALAFYGLLRPSDAMSESNDLRTYSTKNLPQINFGRMLGYYTRDFRAADVVSAVDYLTLICLNSDLGGEAGRRHSELCHESLRELVLETREYSKLIADIRPDGRRIRGVIEERGRLIDIDGEEQFVNTVTLQAASFADENGRTTDAVLLYHLAGEYDTVVAIVSRALSEAIAQEIGEDPMRLMPVKPRAVGDAEAPPGSSLSLAAIDDPVELARTMMQIYDQDAMYSNRIMGPTREACHVLLRMSTIKTGMEHGQWANCLDAIRELEILPLQARGDPSAIRAYAAKFTGLPQPVAINVPNLLLWTIACCTRQRATLSRDGQYSGNEGTKRQILEQLRQITLDLTTYTSQLKYRFPPHLHEALARASAVDIP